MENKISQANKYLMTVPAAVTPPVWLTFLSSITFLSDTICSSKIVCRSSLVQYFPQIHWLAVLAYEILSVVVVQWQERWGNYRAVCPLVFLQCIAVVNAVRPLIWPIVKKSKEKRLKYLYQKLSWCCRSYNVHFMSSYMLLRLFWSNVSLLLLHD